MRVLQKQQQQQQQQKQQQQQQQQQTLISLVPRHGDEADLTPKVLAKYYQLKRIVTGAIS